MARSRGAVIVPLAALMVGCDSPQNALDPRGDAAAAIEQLWWVLFAIATLVSIVVIAILAFAVWQSRRRRRGRHVSEVSGRMLVAVGGAGIPALILIGTLVYNFSVGLAVHPPVETEPEALTIEVIGHQFWWEVRYADFPISTANEIRIPVGRRVRFILRAPDVIHSFWVPQLHGKIDMIPGRSHTLYVEAEEPGMFRGQCAEFCGVSHALMAFWVEAVPEEEFDAWALARTAPAVEPTGATVARGREIFFEVGCGECHATRGAPLPEPFGEPAPDLTDLASRSTLAAGTIPNTRGALAGWISDPQRIKPGSHMPETHLEAADLQALLDYLETLR